jgi:hypothetical protein
LLLARVLCVDGLSVSPLLGLPLPQTKQTSILISRQTNISLGATKKNKSLKMTDLKFGSLCSREKEAHTGGQETCCKAC